MTALIKGSVALKHWFPDLDREPKDLDIISPDAFYLGPSRKNLRDDIHWVPSFQYVLDNNKDTTYVDPDFLYTIKVSHAAWNVWWDKTMHDIVFLRKKGCKLDHKLYKMLFKEWELKHGSKKNIKVDGQPEEFFVSTVVRKIPHDKLHEMVKFYDRPLHERIRPDLTSVKCDKGMWEKLSHEDKLKLALEEAYVFALERFEKYPPKVSLYKAFKQLITSATKGYFNLFMIENFDELMRFDKTRFLGYYQQYKEITRGN